MVEVELKEWGNSVGAILPAELLRRLKLRKGDKVNIEIVAKKRVDGFGVCRGAESFEEEREGHKELWD